MAMIGAFLGWELALLTFFMAPLLGSVAGIFTKIRYKKDILPYAPYISMAAFLSLLYGKKIIDKILYLGM
jgi:leader peptidase (prepilin peptidase)/N-methyltransferase